MPRQPYPETYNQTLELQGVYPSSISLSTTTGEALLKIHHSLQPKGILNHGNALAKGWSYGYLTEPHGEQTGTITVGHRLHVSTQSLALRIWGATSPIILS